MKDKHFCNDDIAINRSAVNHKAASIQGKLTTVLLLILIGIVCIDNQAVFRSLNAMASTFWVQKYFHGSPIYKSCIHSNVVNK